MPDDDLRERIARGIEERMADAREAARLLGGEDGGPGVDGGPLRVLNGMIAAYAESARIARQTPAGDDR